MVRLRGYSEKWLEDRLGNAFTQAGFQNFHMSSPALPGIPDRYVIGARGLWIEVKQGATFAELRYGFDRQRTFLTKLMRGGDLAFVCAYLQHEQDWNDPRLYLEPWPTWMKREQHRVEQLQVIKGSPYQITHPDDVTVAMMRFAESFR